MELEKIPALLEEHSKRIKKLEEEVYPFTKITLVPASGPYAEKDETPGLAELIEPRIVNGNIFLPLLGRTIAVDFIENEEKYNWKQAMDYCKEHGLELPSKDEALILLWQFDKINALLRSKGKPEISSESWFWTKTEHPQNSATDAWYWNSGTGTTTARATVTRSCLSSPIISHCSSIISHQSLRGSRGLSKESRYGKDKSAERRKVLVNKKRI